MSVTYSQLVQNKKQLFQNKENDTVNVIKFNNWGNVG